MAKVQVGGKLHWDGMKPDGAEIYVNFGGGPFNKDLHALEKEKDSVNEEGFRESHHPLKRILKAVGKEAARHVKAFDKDVIINTLTGKKEKSEAVRTEIPDGSVRLDKSEASRAFADKTSLTLDRYGNIYSEKESITSIEGDLKEKRMDKIRNSFGILSSGMGINNQFLVRMNMCLKDGMEYNDAEKKVSKDLLKEFSPKRVQKCLEENSKNFVGVKADKFVNSLADKSKENAGRDAQRSAERTGRSKGFDITD